MPNPNSSSPARPAAQEPLLWGLNDLAAALGISPRTAKRYAADGTLPAGSVVRIGRRRLFRRGVILAWVERGCPATPARRR